MLCRQLRSRAKAHKAAKPPDFAQGKIPSILNHEAKMLACKGISARPSMSHRAALRVARAAARRRYLSHDKFMGILYHEAKMLACKGIFARPSIAQPRESTKAAKPPDFAQGKIPSILNHEAKMLACKGISARPSMSHRAALRVARAAACRRYLPYGKYHVNIILH